MKPLAQAKLSQSPTEFTQPTTEGVPVEVLFEKQRAYFATDVTCFRLTPKKRFNHSISGLSIRPALPANSFESKVERKEPLFLAGAFFAHSLS